MASVPPDRLYHGGPAALSGTLLPRDATGVAGVADVLSRSPGASGALQDVLWGPDRVYLTSDARTARYFAATSAVQHSRRFGTVYRVSPLGELEPDIDTAWSWAVRSATVTGVHDAVVLASDQARLGRALARRRTSGDHASWLLSFTDDDRADAIDTLNARAAERGEAGRPWLDLMAAWVAGDFSQMDETTGALMGWAAGSEPAYYAP